MVSIVRAVFLIRLASPSPAYIFAIQISLRRMVNKEYILFSVCRQEKVFSPVRYSEKPLPGMQLGS
jgi:hypothetical protein